MDISRNLILVEFGGILMSVEFSKILRLVESSRFLRRGVDISRNLSGFPWF